MPGYIQPHKGRGSYKLWEQNWKHARAGEISAKLRTFHLFHIPFSHESCLTKETTRSAQNRAMEACLSFTLLILPGPNCILQLKPQPRAWILSVFCIIHKHQVCACRCLNRPQARPRHSWEGTSACLPLGGVIFPSKAVNTRATMGGPPTWWVQRRRAVPTRWESDGRRYFELTSHRKGWPDITRFCGVNLLRTAEVNLKCGKGNVKGKAT